MRQVKFHSSITVTFWLGDKKNTFLLRNMIECLQYGPQFEKPLHSIPFIQLESPDFPTPPPPCIESGHKLGAKIAVRK